MQSIIRIGTRKSKLALVQTDTVKQKIKELFPEIQVELVTFSTKGDELLDRSLTSFGGKGVFTKELEEALLSGEIDLAVHSAKDMPMEFPTGLQIGAVLPRAAVEDVIVTRAGRSCTAPTSDGADRMSCGKPKTDDMREVLNATSEIKDEEGGQYAKDKRDAPAVTSLMALPPGSVVGTSSLRRELQIRRINPLVKIKMLRGNVQTRLRKLAEGQYDAIVLAAAGLMRLGLDQDSSFHYEYLAPEQCLPAAGQAILAVESREGCLTELLEKLNDPCSAVMLSAERAFLTEIGGSCNAPAAALSRLDGDTLRMDAMFASDGIHMKKVSGESVTGLDTGKAAKLGTALAKKIRTGKVWLVGAGPGNKDLITQKCLSCVRAADVIVYDSLATDSLLNEARPDAELIYAGKRSSHHHLRQEETNALLIRLAKEGKNVVRLKGGDPFIFGRGGEEAEELLAAEVPFEIVCGVSSCYSAPAYAGIPVTHRDHASSFHVITGHEGSHKTSNVLDYATLALEEGTLIFLMGLKNLPNIVKNLIENGKDKNTPAAVIQEGTTARQKVALGTLATIVEDAAKAGIQTPAITVVGDVASLRKRIDWFGKDPLSGKRVLLTATPKMAQEQAEVLEAEGAETIRFSLIYTQPLLSEEIARAVAQLSDYSWLVFTSSNGVDIFFDYLLECGKDLRSLVGIRLAVIGEGTRRALAARGLQADFVPGSFSSKALAREWIPTLTKNDHILLLRAEVASQELNRALDAAGISYTADALYRTAVDTRKEEELRRLLQDVDYVTLCSASAARAFASMTRGLEYRAQVVCIGPVTEKAARAAGIPVGQSAVVYDAEGIRDVLLYEVR